jgi:hypothetical protein
VLLCTRLAVVPQRSRSFFRKVKKPAMRHAIRMLSRALPALLFALLFFAAPVLSRAVSCITQGGMQPADRDLLASAAQRLVNAVAQQDAATLQSSLLPAVAQQWEGIHDTAQAAAPLVKGGQMQLRSLYLLDATSLTAPADTQFFCTTSSGGLTVTISMRGLPPGKYALVLADAAGAPLAGQVGLVLGWDSSAWKIGGIFARPGAFDGHDGVYYWQRAREAARSGAPWAAYYAYEAARALLLPVDFLSSPNLDKLNQEQSQIAGAPVFPYSAQSGDRTFKIDSVHFDTSLRVPDLGFVYESTGVTDPAAQRTEATAAMSAFLKAQPALRAGFHGLWAYSSTGGKISPVMELPMNQIP